MKGKFALCGLIIVVFAAQVVFADWVKKTAETSWTWFEDYFFAYATYVVACEPGRECQVGMGIFAFGEPRGEKIRFSGEKEVTVIGLGSLHLRATDGKEPAKAAILLKDAKVITTPPITW